MNLICQNRSLEYPLLQLNAAIKPDLIGQLLTWTAFLACLLVALVLLRGVAGAVRLWCSARLHGLNLGFFELTSMKLRGTDLQRLIEAAALSERRRLGLSLEDLESHALAGGDPLNVVRAVDLARRLGQPLRVREALKLDLSGYQPFKAVQEGRLAQTLIEFGRSRAEPEDAHPPTFTAPSEDGQAVAARVDVSLRLPLSALCDPGSIGALEGAIRQVLRDGFARVSAEDLLTHPERVAEAARGRLQAEEPNGKWIAELELTPREAADVS